MSALGPDRGQRGAVATEAALLIPAFILVLALMIAGFRVWSARSAATQAAQSAARAASLQHSASLATPRAMAIAVANLQSDGFECLSSSVSLDTSDFAKPAGASGDVGVTVTCQVSLSDLLLPGLPGSMTLTGSATSPLDTFRQRGP